MYCVLQIEKLNDLLYVSMVIAEIITIIYKIIPLIRFIMELIL